MAEPRQALAVGAVAALVLVLAFLTGRFSRPARVEERLRVEKVEVEKQVVVTQERVRVETVERVRTVEVARRLERQEHRPDGTVIVERAEELQGRKDAWSGATASHEAQSHQEASRAALSRTERKSLESEGARWMVGGTVGAALARPVPIYGVTGAYRLGPLWLGAWGTSEGRVGASLALQF